jgi:hypothetical protein
MKAHILSSVPLDFLSFDAAAMLAALDAALKRPWDRAAIRNFTEQNSWDERVGRLCRHFLRITGGQRKT